MRPGQVSDDDDIGCWRSVFVRMQTKPSRSRRRRCQVGTTDYGCNGDSIQRIFSHLKADFLVRECRIFFPPPPPFMLFMSRERRRMRPMCAPNDIATVASCCSSSIHVWTSTRQAWSGPTSTTVPRSLSDFRKSSWRSLKNALAGAPVWLNSKSMSLTRRPQVPTVFAASCL